MTQIFFRHIGVFMKYCLLLILALACIFFCVGVSSLLRSGLFSIYHTVSLNGEEAALTVGLSSNVLTVVERSAETGNYQTLVFTRNDGKFLWSTAGNNPVVGGQYLYMWANGPDHSSQLNALRLSDGKEVWQYTAQQLGSGQIQVVNGILFCNCSNYPYSTVLALDANTGRLFWSRAVPDRPALAGMQVAGSVVYLWGAEGIDALHAQDGSVLWHSPLPNGNPLYLMGQGDRLYLMSEGFPPSFYALEASTGKQLWKFTVQGSHRGNLIGGTDQVIYLAVDGMLYALRTSNGAVLWSQALPNAGQDVLTRSFTFATDAIYDASGDNRLSAFSTKGGTRLWDYAGDYSGMDTLAVVGATDEAVYAQTPDKLVALRASDGQQVWQMQVGKRAAALLVGSIAAIVQATYSGDPPHDVLVPSPATCRLTIMISALNAQTGIVNWQQKHIHLCA